MTDKQVIIYSTPTWPYCKRAKEYLSQKGVSYVEHDVAVDKNALKEMVLKSKQMGVPVIIIGDEIMIGFDQAKIDQLLS